MVVWMASRNSTVIAKFFYNIFAPVQILTVTIIEDISEAAQNMPRYHVFFAMNFAFLIITLVGQKIINYQYKKMSK